MKKTEKQQNSERRKAIGKAIGWNIIPLFIIAGLTLAFTSIGDIKDDVTEENQLQIAKDFSELQEKNRQDSDLLVSLTKTSTKIDSLFVRWKELHKNLIELPAEMDESGIESDIETVKHNIDKHLSTLRSSQYQEFSYVNSLVNQYSQRKLELRSLLRLKRSSKDESNLLAEIEDLEEI